VRKCGFLTAAAQRFGMTFRLVVPFGIKFSQFPIGFSELVIEFSRFAIWFSLDFEDCSE
jgi:hypothetical protein